MMSMRPLRRPRPLVAGHHLTVVHYEPELRIRELLQAYPRMSATVIAERIGGGRGLAAFKECVAELRPVCLRPDPGGPDELCGRGDRTVRSVVPPIDLSAGFGRVRRPALVPVLTMVADYSRSLSAVLIPTPVGDGSVHRLVAADRDFVRGAAGAGMGR
jgi:hypothetical protein